MSRERIFDTIDFSIVICHSSFFIGCARIPWNEAQVLDAPLSQRDRVQSVAALCVMEFFSPEKLR